MIMLCCKELFDVIDLSEVHELAKGAIIIEFKVHLKIIYFINVRKDLLDSCYQYPVTSGQNKQSEEYL